MAPRQITPDVSVTNQMDGAALARAASAGYRTIVCARPDGEEPGQPDAAEMALLADALGMAFVHIPVAPGAFDDEAVAQMRAVLDKLPSPILGYCRSGMRAATLWALAEAGHRPFEDILGLAGRAGFDLSAQRPRLAPAPTETDPGSAPAPRVHDVVIVGGGAAGIATASSLLKRRPSLDIAIVEPATCHYYQPGWTMVGAGIFKPETTRHPMAEVMPAGVTWIRQAAAGFAPQMREVMLADGASVRYRALVVAPGLRLAWDAIPGLSETLGENGVTSNYRYDLAPYTYRLASDMRPGRALFTQPAMPIKCAGAPQKAMYLCCDIWREAGILPRMEVEFHNAGGVLFGVPTYVPALMDYVERYGIDLNFGSTLVAVDGPARIATFERKGADGRPERVERTFDMLHAVPPQTPLDVIAASPLAGPGGWIEVDPATLRHVRHEDVFALGDATDTPNAKTAAAARKQAPVVAVNVLAALDGKAPAAQYNGYGSCPLTVERGRIVLAEFGYGGALLPTFPKWMLDGTRPTRRAWFLKDRMLPPIYWYAMLRGREWLCAPEPIAAPPESGPA
ncbi:bifunctional protein tyrosine phosphatase family protein/NAD(P)/FAD-dependent oxidoreductase [Ancylobacter sp. MQZ15Z-1]|uniref:Bifunctional protein tyrosine phosphatase family protein/NAD(P)/FAD-dependent oxidoreductase n=1 Tax=Ancylobacter mangrovi TaxID=2972472 RepID=A0A9X2PGL5_9HYPH|nr:bifunctional protein tyrosine phosphatase family protein/NAD(P)/FAD-dependent oxidoreductase [Ancylobacter mangrovi]MCS0495813.1 bifunctional protein tyrosine phosphatase family protein/NAD(P)/FAD-dependent oxidoreductase [Ancylobacter mangrovi]